MPATHRLTYIRSVDRYMPRPPGIDAYGLRGLISVSHMEHLCQIEYIES